MHIRKISQNGLNLIKYFEGFRSKPYLCEAGKPTIGYGFTRYPNGQRVTLNDPPITEEWAEVVLSKLLEQYEAEVDAATNDNITQNQFDALVSFVFNIGITNYKASTIRKLINNNPSDPNIAVQFARWKYSDNKPSRVLIRRRKLESELYFKQ
jgi:lysozyme